MTKNLERLESKAGQAVRREASTRVASLARAVNSGKLQLVLTKVESHGQGQARAKAEQRKRA
jgi:hypothetical protein